MMILSLDGGGIKGLIPLCFLVELERETGKTVPEMFDFFAGTSIGAIIAALFAYKKLSAKEIMDSIFTKERVDRIFPKSTLDSIFGIVQFQPKYQDSKLYQIMQELFGDQRMSNTDKKVMITGFDLQNNKPIFFKNYFGKPDLDPLVSDACTLSSSAPFYFSPHRMADGGQQTWGLDGGIVNCNPADCALIDAIRLRFKEISLLSIGTGYPEELTDVSDCESWGITEWFTKGNLVRMMMGGNVDSSSYRAKSLSQALDFPYVRVQHPIPVCQSEMDNFCKENIDRLNATALDWWVKDGESVLRLFQS